MIKGFINKIFQSFFENRYLSRWFVLIIDTLTVALASIFSYLVTSQIYSSLKVIVHPNLGVYLTITLSSNILLFLILRTYQGIIRYSTIHEIRRIFIALVGANALIFSCLFLMMGLSGSVSLLYCCMLFLVSFVGLFFFRITVIHFFQVFLTFFGSNRPIPVYIWGADKNDIPLSQAINSSYHKFRIKGFFVENIDPVLKNMTNLPVYRFQDFENILKYKTRRVLFTDRQLLKDNSEYVEKMLSNNIRIYVAQLKNIESVKSLDETIYKNIRPLQIEDLLSRPEINISLEIIDKYIKGKTVLVTGAAGSIGSEIVRQLANFNPKCIACLDQAETPLNDLQLELEHDYPSLQFISIIGDIRNLNKLNNIFQKIKPDIVYHAAAYKHVPMMEKCPSEAIITNVLGTKNLVDLAIKHFVGMFVMISTDKAVNPTNIMGASKRIAEIYVQSAAMDINKNHSNTKFVTTRFGNVLGSNGSVIPLFKKQIESGGPVTVTHPEITRYFMTIPEACRLVLEASFIGQSGYIYVFDMGKPVKILDMATRMIELAGLRPNKEIKIEFTGLRSGEKLYEELLSDSELSIPTSHEKVLIAKVREYDFAEIVPIIDKLIAYAKAEDNVKLVTTMKELVTEFISKNSEYESIDREKTREVLKLEH